MRDDSTPYDEFWARFFALDVAHFRNAGVNVVAHAQLADYPGIWFFLRGASIVVSSPAAWVDRIRSGIDQIAAEPLPSPRLLRALLGSDPAREIGPAYQGYLPAGAFRPVRDANVRRLGPRDESLLLDLRSACAPEEWEHSALSIANEPLFGYFHEAQLVAAAASDHWTPDALSPGVLSRPDQRGRGFAAAVVSAVVENALASGALPLYQTLVENPASVAVAERLGYRRYGTHLAVRLQPEAT